MDTMKNTVYEVTIKTTYSDIIIVEAESAKAATTKAFGYFGSLTVPFSEMTVVHTGVAKL